MKGTYLLILYLAAPCHHLRIGQLGYYDFAAGYYLYVGSAFGIGGLPVRLAYHRQPHKVRPHWHIDYLRPHADLQAIWSVACPQRLEPTWCHALMEVQGVEIPIRGFGSSDTRLPSHLFYMVRLPSIRFLSSILLSDTLINNPDAPQMVVEIQRLGDDEKVLHR